MQTTEKIECESHGNGHATYICVHLFKNSEQKWYSSEISDDNPWPDAWCQEWNENNEDKIKIKLICHECYEIRRPDCFD